MFAAPCNQIEIPEEKTSKLPWETTYGLMIVQTSPLAINLSIGKMLFESIRIFAYFELGKTTYAR